jgi:signal transduction histidine kinase/AraC-like DNA-binding protein/ligand-binding sensor domain-containing protein/ActR/RegA family two-component response regulator
MKYKYIICIWLLFGMGAATSQNLPFEKITIEQGLSQGMIFSILQTRDGFLWVATKDGLNRYDGYNFKVFSNNPFDSLSIAGNTVSALFEDSRGWLWVGIEGIGAEIYDPRTGHFHLVSFRFESTKRSPNLHVDHIGEAADGSILVLLASGGLLRIEIPEGWKKGIPPQADLSRQTKISPIKVENLIERQEPLTKFLTGIDGKIALFSSRRQFQVEVETNTAKLIRHTNLPDSIRSIGRAIGQQGWWIMDAECRLFWANDQGVFPAQTQIMDLPFANISTDSWGKCWLLMGKKLWQLEKNYRTIDLSKPDWEFDKDITQVQSDRDGNIWVGTWGYGLRKINLKNQLFSTGATGNSIWRLWRSPAGKYYCRKGLLKIYPFDPLTGLLGEQLAFPELGDKGKRDLCFEPSGAFWVLASTPVNIDPHGFLCRFDASGQLTQTYPFDFFGYDYSKLITDRDGYLWATGAFSQLVRFDPRTAQFRYFDYSQVFGENPRASQSFDFVQDGNGVFWLATQKGLIKCTPKTPDDLDFKLFQTDPKNPRGLNHNSIACLLPDPARPAERLWIGTKGGGINCLDLKTNEFRYLTQADGMPDKVVYAILPGNENPAQSPVSLWASTNRGLVKLTQRADAPFAFDFITYSAAQGLQDNEFNTQAFFKASNGELLFGGVNGMNHFFPEKLQADTAVPPVFIVGLEINHERADVRDAKIQLVNPPEYLQKLELSHDQNNISIEFAALDFTDPSKNRYRYRLIGLDVDWVETGNHRFAYFSHLAPGTYELRVQGNNGESAWREASPLILVVNPPWYRSKLAYLYYALLLAWLGWHVYQFQIRRIKEREQLAFEHRETERIKVLEQLKTNFFSNITHEFRTPLTLMIEPLRRILPKIKDPEVLENVQLAEKNSRQLLGLINQLLDMAKLESGQMGLDLRRSNIGETVRNTFERFLPLAEKRGIKLVMAALPNDLPLFDFDAGKVELVLNNLISNALKFTLEGGKVEVAVGRVSKSSDVENIEISVCDTGIGIAPENLDKIFDRFYQVDGSYTRSGEGTGIGLALSKELAALMGGQILVESPDPKSGGKGTVFKLALPVSGAINMVNTATLALDVIPLNPVQPSQSLSETRAGAKAIHADMPVVLVVEDNNELRNFIKNAMVEGWQVVEASDGEDGLKKALDIVPDIVVSDVMMPRKDGLTLLDELKNHELTAHIPVVLLTSKSAIESRLKGLRHGADDYLTKPFSVEELLTRMENLVETRRRLRAIFGKQASSFATLSSGIAQGVTPTFLSEPDREFLQKFILILEKNLADETLGVEDFAQKMFISRVQLHRKLKALTDQPATNFIRDYRLECALTMLKNREGRVGEIALRVGFGNEKYFSTAFKEKFGVSPSQV